MYSRRSLIPRDWLRFRSMDWGSASLASVGWWAVVLDDFTAPNVDHACEHRHIQEAVAHGKPSLSARTTISMFRKPL